MSSPHVPLKSTLENCSVSLGWRPKTTNKKTTMPLLCGLSTQNTTGNKKPYCDFFSPDHCTGQKENRKCRKPHLLLPHHPYQQLENAHPNNPKNNNFLLNTNTNASGLHHISKKLGLMKRLPKNMNLNHLQHTKNCAPTNQQLQQSPQIQSQVQLHHHHKQQPSHEAYLLPKLQHPLENGTLLCSKSSSSSSSGNSSSSSSSFSKSASLAMRLLITIGQKNHITVTMGTLVSNHIPETVAPTVITTQAVTITELSSSLSRPKC